MTDHDINRVLGDFMGFPPCVPGPDFCSDFNALREVVEKLTQEHWDLTYSELSGRFAEIQSTATFVRHLLTCDPRIIAQAVAEVVAQSKM